MRLLNLDSLEIGNKSRVHVEGVLYHALQPMQAYNFGTLWA